MLKLKEKNTLIIISVIVVVVSLFWEDRSDVLGLSCIESNVLSALNVIANMILPILFIIFTILNKSHIQIILLVLKNLFSTVPIYIWANENGSIDNREIAIVVLGIIYEFMLLLYLKNQELISIVIIVVIVCRLATLILDGSVENFIYGLRYENVYFLGNTLFMLSTELLYILPLVFFRYKRKVMKK